MIVTTVISLRLGQPPGATQEQLPRVPSQGVRNILFHMDNYLRNT